jgi:ribonucleotide reductase alpha subunit
MIQLSDNSLKVLQSRYLRKDSDGIISETPEKLY